MNKISLNVLLALLLLCLSSACVAKKGALRSPGSQTSMQIRHSNKKNAAARPADTTSGNADEEEKQWIETDMPYTVTPGQSFKIDVWLMGLPPDDHKIRKVYMEQTDAIEYSPRVLDVEPGKPATTRAKILKTNSGLAVIELNSEGFETYQIALNAGFNAKTQIQTTEDFDSGNAYGVTLKFTNQEGLGIALDAPVTVVLRASKALLRPVGGDTWSQELRLHLREGATATDLFEMKPTSVSGRAIGLSSSIQINDDDVDESFKQVVNNEYLKVNVKPAWWLVLGLAMLGGIISTVYRIAQALASDTPAKVLFRQSIFKLITGALSGAAAYLLADLDVIGVKLDTTSPRTFCILGFLFAYIGMDFFVNKFAAARSGSSAGKTEATEHSQQNKEAANATAG